MAANQEPSLSPRRFAVLGCGRMGRLHTTRLQQDARSKVTTLFDVDRSMAERLQQDLLPHASVCNSLEELLARDDVDAAVICTPTSSHAEQLNACLAQQWPVLCEKPLADSAEAIRELIEIVSQSGTPCSIAYQRRSSALYRTLRREVLSGRWGPVRSVSSHTSERWQQTIAGTWRDDPAINVGGFLGDAGSHKVDVLFYVTGLDVAEVFARSDKCGSRVEIVTSISAISTDGVPITLDFAGNAHHLSEDLHIHCAEADLMIRDMRPWIARHNSVEPIHPLEPESQPVESFLNLLDESSPNDAPIECAWPVFAFTQATLESAATGRRVNVPSQ
ncbi:MAG: Gfo/Idh/MocA family oxidoreductase [Planctomycetaceae bacterium]